MPSTQWLAKRRQIKMYVTNEEYAQLKAITERKGLTLTDALRQALALWYKKG